CAGALLARADGRGLPARVPLRAGSLAGTGFQPSVGSRVPASMARMAIEPLRALLTEAFPDAAELDAVDRTGTGDHFPVVAMRSRFDGLLLVEQPRLVYDALARPL